MDRKSSKIKDEEQVSLADIAAVAKDVQHIRELMYVKFESNTATLEKNTADISQMNAILGENVRQLAIHIEGVRQLKDMNILMREEIMLFRNKVDAEITEINSRMNKVEVPFVWFKITSSFAEKAVSILKFVLILAAGFGADKIISKFLE